MKLTNIDINELLPIYAQGQPIANAIGEAVASALGGIFARCESLPCEASRIACDAMRDDELDAVAKDLQIVIYDPSATHDEKARFVYEFAGTRYTAGSYANLKKGLSIFANIPEWGVKIERESTWRYYIQLESPPAVSIERQRIMERLISKAHRAVLGFDGMDIHYGNTGKSDLFTSAGNACADTLYKGKTATRENHGMILRHVREPADTNACELTPAQGSVIGNKSVLRARPYKLSSAGVDYTDDTFMREDDLTVAMANSYIARKTVHDAPVGDELRFQNDYIPEPTLRFGDTDYLYYLQLTDIPYMFNGAISPLPVFGLRKELRVADNLSAQAYFADMTIDEQTLNAACKYKVKRYCVGLFMDVLELLGEANQDDAEYYTQGIFAGEYTELFGAFLKVPNNFASLQAWGAAYNNNEPAAYQTWCDLADGKDATHYWDVFDSIEIARLNTSSTSRLRELTLEQWVSFLIPFPREWA